MSFGLLCHLHFSCFFFKFCSQNAAILDNGEENHCEWGITSRDGWHIYDDTSNFILDSNDWWVGTNNPNPPARTCNGGQNGVDVQSSTRSSYYPSGTTAPTAGDCCSRCLSAPDCVAWVYATDGSNNCWPLAGWAGSYGATNRVFGTVTNATASGAQQNGDAMDLYGFFHGHDYFGAMQDFVSISGKTIMVPKYASGVWWSRWYDLNNQDLLNVVWDYGNRRIPLDVFVIDMDWHSKDNWSGFTFDSNLFPYPGDTMSYLKALGLPVTLNIHDASGVNNWEAKFQELVQYLGLPPSSTVVPLNLVNSTVAYAVEDIVLGDLIYNKNVSFMWIDWQQGGVAGGMTGSKQNPTMWLNHLRCTDRHRVGDNNRAMVLARWGGLGGHRYQVGFSGDVAQLTWGNLAYQPYFSLTAVNVGHGFWSHDIEGPGNDAEMFTRWIQVGTFSGTMRSHDRGMSAGGCANSNPFSCSVVEPWNAPNVNFPAAFINANRQALTWRSYFLPTIYNGHRSAFDTGVGLLRPLYYHYPEAAHSYDMDANGNSVQYMFGPSTLVSPVVTAGDSTVLAPAAGCATKNTWLPPGTTWVDANSGVITQVALTDVNHYISKQFAINEIPMWYVGGSVIPYMPTRSLPTTVGNAARAYSALGFKIVPTLNASGANGAVNGSVSVYEDDGATTAYLTDNAYAWTTATYSTSQGGMAMKITVQTTLAGPAFPELPSTRSLYQFTLMNSAPIASVTANGVAVPYNRYGRAMSQGRAPSSSSHHYAVDELPWGMGAVIDIVNVDTTQPLTIQIQFAEKVDPTVMSGVYGAIMHSLWAKGNMDEDRSTPGSENGNVVPAHMSVLASVGGALEYLAGANTTAWVETVESVPSLLEQAINEVSPVGSPRVPYSLSLLRSAMV
jgi:alpha-glucosidase (family GH31 glycosyl hydrolase)